MTENNSSELRRKFARAAEKALWGTTIISPLWPLFDYYAQGTAGLHLINVTAPVLLAMTAYTVGLEAQNLDSKGVDQKTAPKLPQKPYH